MEYGSRLRFALLTIGGIVLLILSVWGVTSIAKRILGGESKPTTSTKQQIFLDDYARPNTVVKLTVEGPIVADEKFVSYEIDVAQNYRQIKTFKGYNKTLVDNKYYNNNNEAYVNFLKALRRYNFTAKTKSTSEDEKGTCATGNRYIYQLTDQDTNTDTIRSWNTSCGTVGSFAGLGSSIRSLFRAQIPDYDEITKTIQILL
jgi:hypothetical protein